MKMHGLGDGPYWMISYAYFLLLSCLYMLVFVFFGSIIGKTFRWWINYFFFTFYSRCWQNEIIYFYVRVKVLHTKWLQHPICIFFHLHKLASGVGFSRCWIFLKREDRNRFNYTFYLARIMKIFIMAYALMRISCLSCRVYNGIWNGPLGWLSFPILSSRFIIST